MDNMDTNHHGSISSLYTDLEDTTLLKRLELYAMWTIPSIFPKDTTNRFNNKGNAEIEHDYQSVGSRLVNSLASKLTGTLFPYSTSFFRIQASSAIEEMLNKNNATKESKQTLVGIEQEANKALFKNASYAQLVQLTKLLTITGNALLVRKDQRCKVYSLQNYVIKRNGGGDVENIILKEYLSHRDIPEEVRTALGLSEDAGKDAPLELYTHVKVHYTLAGDGTTIKYWKVTQELDGKDTGTDEVFTEYECPYIPVVWNLCNGDSYGRGYVEEYMGDFAKLSELSQRFTEYELESLRLIHVYDPARQFDLDELQSAENGDFVQGDPAAIKAYEVGVYQKLQQVQADLTILIQRLEQAFMFTGNTPQGERVTAYEIGMNAKEADSQLGGVYSQLSLSLHMPLAYLLLAEVQPDLMKAIIKGEWDINLVTGLQALSRSSENQALLVATQQIASVAQVFNSLNQIAPRYNIDAIIDKLLLGNGISVDDVTYTPEQIKAMQEAKIQQLQAQQAQQQQVAAQASTDIAQGNAVQQQQAIQMAQGVNQ